MYFRYQRYKIKWLKEILTLKKEMKTDDDDAAMRESFSLVQNIVFIGYSDVLFAQAVDHSQSLFLVHTSGKETPLATPLNMEKYRRFDFSPCKHEYLARNRLKSMMAHAEVAFGLFRFLFRALLGSGD